MRHGSSIRRFLRDSALAHRIRNGVVRRLLRYDRAQPSPESPTDFYQTIRAIHSFIGQRVTDGDVAVLDCGSGWMTLEYRRAGTRVTGFDRGPRSVAQARQRFGGHAAFQILQRVDDLPEKRASAVVAVHSPIFGRSEKEWRAVSRGLAPAGELWVAVPPHQSAPVVDWARKDFLEIGIFDQVAKGRSPDLASPLPSFLTPDDFSFVPRSGSYPAPGTLTTIVHCRSRRDAAIPCDRLHIGAGQVMLPGWVNVDLVAYPGIDYAVDVTRGLPFRDVRLIFAEHFIEHLPVDDGLRFLRSCREVLRDDGVLRLSTPNLEWILASHYSPWKWSSEREAVEDAFGMNKAFHGWGHQFSYSPQMLRALLRAAGFAEVRDVRYGESEHEELRNLEKHEKSGDTPELSHVVVVEATGRAEPRIDLIEPFFSKYVTDVACR